MNRSPATLLHGARHPRFVRLALWVMALTVVVGRSPAAELAAKIAFDIPAANASAALRQFATQSGVQVIFLEDAIDGVRTHALKGEFTPSDAMDRLIADTGLKASRDERSGAFAVTRMTAADPDTSPREAGATRADARVRPAAAPASDELITLTPFEVSTARDDGFVASQSLAGGRLAGDLKDTPAAYSVMTRELIDALNVIDLTEANEWMVNATSNDDRGSGELIGGIAMINSRGVSANNPSRNFFLLPVNFDSYNLDRYDFSRGPNAILFGESTFGGSSNVLTKTARTDRTFGRTNLTFASWSSTRATVDFNQPVTANVALRLNGLVQDNHGFRSYELDRKKAATLDTLWRPFQNTEIRVEGEKGEVARNKPMTPFYDFMTGWDGRTTFSTLQTGTIPQANSKGVTKYGSSTAPYFLFAPGLGMLTVANFANTARTFGGGSSADVPVAGVRYVGTSSPNLYQRPMNEALNVPANRFDMLYANTGFRLPGREFALSTNEPTSKQRYNTTSVFVRQRFGANLFAEIAANRATEQRVNNYTNYRGMNNVVLDINSTMPDGSANPRFLEAYSDASRSRLRIGTEYKNLRAAVAYTLRETRFGSYSFNAYGGLAPTKNYQYIETLQVVPDENDLRSVYAAGANANRVFYRYYLSETNRPTPNPTQAFYNMNDGSATPARMHPVLWLGDASRETDESITTRKQNYYQGAVKGVFFGNRLHLLAAARQDRLTINRKVNLGFAKYPADWDGRTYYFRPDAPDDYDELTYYIKDSAGRITNPVPQEALTRPAGAQYADARFKNDYNPQDIHSTASSHSFGGVFHVTNWFSVFGNQATSFLPTSNSRDVTGEFIPGPVSKGYDAGFRLSFLQNRVYVSASHYAGDETAQIQEVTTQTNYIRTIAQANREGDYGGGNNQRNLPQPPSQTADTRDRKNRGYELELMANFTSNWRMMFNAALPRGWQYNNNPILRDYLRQNDELIRGVLADAGVLIDANNTASVRPGLDPNNMAESQNAATAWNNLVQYQQNLVSGEQLINRLVKYTLNINTDYRFSRGWLNRLRVGGGVQFRGREVIGYRGSDLIADPQNPARSIDDPDVDAYTAVYTSGYYLLSLRAGYTLRLASRRSLEFQLNVGNVLNNMDPHYVNTTTRPPGGDLTNAARVSTPNEFYYVAPRNFRFTTTLNF